MDKHAVKDLVRQQIEALKPIRAPWYRAGPRKHSKSRSAAVVGTGTFIPDYSASNVSIFLVVDEHERLAPVSYAFALSGGLTRTCMPK